MALGLGNQWSPRVGAAWDPTGRGTSVIRGGYSLGYGFINAQFHLNTSVAQPWGAEVRLADGQLLDDPFAGSGVTNPFPYVLGKDSPFNLFGPYISIPPDIETPRQQSWNLTFQQQIGRAMAVKVSYLGSHSDRLWNVRSLDEVSSFRDRALSTPRPDCARSIHARRPRRSIFRRKLTMQNWETGRFLGAVDEHTGTRNVDIALVRVFRVDTHRIEARLESFNLMNWTRYNNPAVNFSAPKTFGRITSALDPRIMQFALKYAF